MKRRTYEDWFGMVFFAAACGMLVLSVRLCFADGIWYDELFTMGLTERSFGELTALTARDVHPPVYYYFVKAVRGIIQGMVRGADGIVIGKLCSILPLAGLFVYAATMVRRRFGWLCVGLFAFGITAMPSLSQYTVEIRMYTLAMFFVTAAFLHAYEVVCGVGDSGGSRKKDWACLTVYGILAAYTHYFAGAAAAMVYLFLLAYLIIKKAAKEEKRKWFLCVLASVAAYLPWAAVVVRQMAQVKENYWILPLTWRTFGSCVKFLMKPPFGGGIFQVAAAVVLFAVYVGLLFYGLWKSRKIPAEVFLILSGTGVLAGVVLFGFAASYLLRPVFIVRYMVPAAGCFWLSFAFSASRAVKTRKVFLPVLGLVFLLGIGDYRWFRNDETWRRVRMEEVEEALGQIAPEDAVVTQFNQVQGVAGYYLENEIHLWNAEPELLISDIFENKYFSLSSTEDLKDWMEEGKNVWFIGNKGSGLLEEWKEEGILAEEKQEVMLEVYWITMYRLYEETPEGEP